jgi:hypothetical protein
MRLMPVRHADVTAAFNPHRNGPRTVWCKSLPAIRFAAIRAAASRASRNSRFEGAVLSGGAFSCAGRICDMPTHDAAPFRRTFICRSCGKLRRANGSTPTRTVAPPQCCGAAMRNLMHEQAVAAVQLSTEQRLKWLRAGAKYVRRGGKRPWKAVMRRESN